MDVKLEDFTLKAGTTQAQRHALFTTQNCQYKQETIPHPSETEFKVYKGNMVYFLNITSHTPRGLRLYPIIRHLNNSADKYVNQSHEEKYMTIDNFISIQVTFYYLICYRLTKFFSISEIKLDFRMKLYFQNYI